MVKKSFTYNAPYNNKINRELEKQLNLVREYNYLLKKETKNLTQNEKKI